MIPILGAALALGAAGLDPTAALLAVAALLAGATRRGLLGFALTVMIGAPVMGMVLSVTVAGRMVGFDWSRLLPHDRIGAIATMTLGLILATVGTVRVIRRSVPRQVKPHRVRRVTTPALMALAAGYVASLLIDPTFLAVTVLAGRAANVATALAVQVLWVVLSQIPLLMLMIAVARVGRQGAADRFQVWWSKIKPATAWAVTVALLAAGVLLVADAGCWFTTGRFLIVDLSP